MYLCNRNKYLFPREMDFKGMCMLCLMSVFLTEYKSFFSGQAENPVHMLN